MRHHPTIRPAHDVVVVGARAAGASTAMLLARAGLSVLLVDRDRPGTDTLSTHALMRGGVVQLHRWGLLDRIVAAGTPPVRSTTFHYRDGDVAVAIKPSAGVDALYAPRRTVLDPLLVDAARAHGATVRFGVAVTGVCRDSLGRVVGIETRDRDGRPATVRARLVVGADGRRSTIAREVAAPATHRGVHTSAFVYGYWSDLPTDGYEWAYRPGATAGFIPTNDAKTCVFAGGPPAVVGRGGRGVLDDLVERSSPEMAERLRAATAPPSTRTFTGQPGLPPPPVGTGVGARRRRRVVEGPGERPRADRRPARCRPARSRVVAVHRGEATEPEAYAEYEAVRNRLSAPILVAADEVAAFGWDEGRIVELLLELSEAMGRELEVINGLRETVRRVCRACTMSSRSTSGSDLVDPRFSISRTWVTRLPVRDAQLDRRRTRRPDQLQRRRPDQGEAGADGGAGDHVAGPVRRQVGAGHRHRRREQRCCHRPPGTPPTGRHQHHHQAERGDGRRDRVPRRERRRVRVDQRIGRPRSVDQRLQRPDAQLGRDDGAEERCPPAASADGRRARRRSPGAAAPSRPPSRGSSPPWPGRSTTPCGCRSSRRASDRPGAAGSSRSGRAR